MSKVIGDFGEDLASEYLIENGYKIIERNFRTRAGEIDIIAAEEACLCFVEVKYKVDEGFGTAIEMISKSKMEKILKAARAYLYEKDLFDSDWRIDAVAIDGITKECQLFKNIYIEGVKI